MSIIALVAESGGGKTRTAKELNKRYGYTSIPSYTTRAPRYEGEEGHIFVTEEEFAALRPDMVAYTEFMDKGEERKYGATWQQVEEHDIYVIDPRGAVELVQNMGKENVTIVYLMAGPEVRKQRMIAERGEVAAHERLTYDLEKFYHFRLLSQYDIALKNITESDLERNIQMIHALIEGEEIEWCKRAIH